MKIYMYLSNFKEDLFINRQKITTTYRDEEILHKNSIEKPRDGTQGKEKGKWKRHVFHTFSFNDSPLQCNVHICI